MNEPRFFERALPWLGLVGVWVLACFLRYPIADIPLERDEGGYAYVAQHWMAGEVPYKDTFDLTLPGVYIAYAPLLRWVGTSATVLHWGTQVYSLGTLTLLFLLGWKLFNASTGVIAAALCAFHMGDQCVLGNAANREVFMILPLVGAMYTCIQARERQSFGWSFATGALSGAALIVKQPAVYDVAFYFLLLVWGSKRRWVLAVGMVLGMAAMLLPLIGYFLYAGALREFYDCTIAYGVSYAGRVALHKYPEHFWANFKRILGSCWPIYILAAAGMMPAQSARPEQRNRRLVMVWLFFSFLGVSTGGFFREHYFIQIVPAVALLAAVGVHSLPVPGRMHRWKPAAAYVVVLAALIYGVGVSPSYYLRGSPELKCRKLYGVNPFAGSKPAGQFINKHSNPEDTVFIFGSEPQILFYAQRKSATRYIFVYPLMGDEPGNPARRRAVVRSVAEQSPKFIVTVVLPTSFGPYFGAYRSFSENFYPILENYRRVAAIVADPVHEDEFIEFVQDPGPAFPKNASVIIWQRRGPRGHK